MTKMAINGFGRIGRLSLRAAIEQDFSGTDIVAIHSPGSIDQLAHLLQYDSVHGTLAQKVAIEGDHLVVAGKHIRVLSKMEMTDLPWGEMGIDVVLECSGRFNSKEASSGHLEAGAKKLLISAPAKNVDATVVYGVNHDVLRAEHRVVSNASCTTNCAAPVCKVMNDALGIETANMTTIHAVTGDQPTVDTRHSSDLRRSRAGFQSMVPTSTGAGRTISLIIPELAGRMDGTAMRVPVLNVSAIDLTAQVRKSVTAEGINQMMQEASEGALKNILAYTDVELVSNDFMHHPASSVFDSTGTKCFGKDLVRILAWYDNEWAFSMRMLDVAKHMASL